MPFPPSFTVNKGSLVVVQYYNDMLLSVTDCEVVAHNDDLMTSGAFMMVDVIHITGDNPTISITL